MFWQQLNINIKIFREETPVTGLDNYHLFYREERYSRYSEKFTPIHQTTDGTMAQRVGRRALTAEVQVRSQATPYAICGIRSNSLTGFRLSTSDIFHQARVGELRRALRVLAGKPEGKRPLGRPRRRWVDNISLDLQDVGCGYVDWIGLAQDRDRWRMVVSAVMNLWVP